MKIYTKKENKQVLLIVLLAVLICFMGAGCAKTTLCTHIKKNMVGYN